MEIIFLTGVQQWDSFTKVNQRWGAFPTELFQQFIILDFHEIHAEFLRVVVYVFQLLQDGFAVWTVLLLIYKTYKTDMRNGQTDWSKDRQTD